MNPRETVDQIVREIVRSRSSRLASGSDLPDDIPLGGDGLGLDSIAIAEVLLDCQQRFGVSVTGLLEGEPLTLRLLVSHLGQEANA